jgi:hypothetical protein
VRFRAGLIIGFGVGYVLGAKAGRERYEQIREAFGKAMQTEPVQQLTEKGRAVVDLGAERTKQVLSEGMATASDRIRQRIDG